MAAKMAGFHLIVVNSKFILKTTEVYDLPSKNCYWFVFVHNI